MQVAVDEGGGERVAGAHGISDGSREAGVIGFPVTGQQQAAAAAAGEAQQIKVEVAKQAAGDRPLTHHATYTVREIEFIVRNEDVMHLDDLVLRRTAIALLGELTSDLLDELLAIVSVIRDWSRQQTDAERERTVDILRDRHGIELE